MKQQSNEIKNIKEVNVKDNNKSLYQSPRLVEYGNISKLTKGNSGSGADGNGRQNNGGGAGS